MINGRTPMLWREKRNLWRKKKRSLKTRILMIPLMRKKRLLLMEASLRLCWILISSSVTRQCVGDVVGAVVVAWAAEVVAVVAWIVVFLGHVNNKPLSLMMMLPSPLLSRGLVRCHSALQWALLKS